MALMIAHSRRLAGFYSKGSKPVTITKLRDSLNSDVKDVIKVQRKEYFTTI